MECKVQFCLQDECKCQHGAELKGGRSFQKLGFADVNLAEFAGSGNTSRNYLLEGYDAKHRQDNSTLRITIVMTLLSGDPCFKVPNTRPLSLPGENQEELRRDEQIGGGGSGSLTSGSSGIGSLPRKHRPNVLTSELVTNTTSQPVNEVAAAGGGSSVGNEEFEMTHSRNSSCTSQQSKASGYSSMHSRQSSSESGQQISNNQAPVAETVPVKRDPNEPGRNISIAGIKSPMAKRLDINKHSRHSSLDFVPGHCRNLSSSSSDTLCKMNERKKKPLVDDCKESRMDWTRVCATDLVNEIVNSTNLEDTVESKGLCLYVLEDGTASLGSHKMQARAKPVTIESVVFDNR
uniref:C2 NT-type domain-containing protein n=1 Tax=Strigamia maritima TaxID=126957 RepID=T1JHA3_STRMM